MLLDSGVMLNQGHPVGKQTLCLLLPKGSWFQGERTQSSRHFSCVCRVVEVEETKTQQKGVLGSRIGMSKKAQKSGGTGASEETGHGSAGGPGKSKHQRLRGMSG